MPLKINLNEDETQQFNEIIRVAYLSGVNSVKGDDYVGDGKVSHCVPFFSKDFCTMFLCDLSALRFLNDALDAFKNGCESAGCTKINTITDAERFIGDTIEGCGAVTKSLYSGNSGMAFSRFINALYDSSKTSRGCDELSFIDSVILLGRFRDGYACCGMSSADRVEYMNKKRG